MIMIIIIKKLDIIGTYNYLGTSVNMFNMYKNKIETSIPPPWILAAPISLRAPVLSLPYY